MMLGFLRNSSQLYASGFNSNNELIYWADLLF